jgi:hypothetical protein
MPRAGAAEAVPVVAATAAFVFSRAMHVEHVQSAEIAWIVQMMRNTTNMFLNIANQHFENRVGHAVIKHTSEVGARMFELSWVWATATRLV